MPNKISKIALGFTLLGLYSTPSFAETIDNSKNNENLTPASTTIIISAKRKTERLQDSALTVSTISGKQLENSGNFNVSRLTQVQPAIQFYSQNQRNTTVNIRGLGAPYGLTNDGIEQGVGFYIDDVYYARAASAALDFVDVAQIDILRGPQGTLYGKNTTAGAISITTRAPSFDPEAKASLTYGNYNFTQFKGSVSSPLTDKIAARLSTSFTSRDGLSYNIARKEKVNELNNLSVRGQILWNATDDLKLTFSGDYSEQNPNGAGQVYVKVAPTQRAVTRQYAALAANFGYNVPSTNPFDRLVDHDSKTRGLQHNSGASLKVNYNVLGGKLTSVSAWRTWSWRPSNDRDWIGIPITTVSANPSDSEQYQQEFRFNKTLNDKIDYLVGAFYFSQKIRSSGNTALGSAASYWLNGPANAATNAALLSVTGSNDAAAYSSVLNGLTQTSDVRLDTKSAALFGRVTWKVTDKFSIEPGIRYNYDTKDAYYDAVVTGGLQTTNAVLKAIKDNQLASSFYVADFEDTNISGDITLSYKVDKDILLYGIYAHTFKSGGVNLNGIPNGVDGLPAVKDFATVKPEAINHGEIGLKTQFLGNRLTLNFAGYLTEIEDYQAIVQLAASGSSTLRGVLASVPEVRVRGVEIESSYRPNSNWLFYLNVTSIDSRYIDFPNAPVALERSGGSISVENISGAVLPGVSKLSASYGFEYKQAAKLISANDEIYFGLDGVSRSKFSSSSTPSDYLYIDGYTLFNARAGIRTANNWDFAIWGKNLGDVKYFNQLTAQSGSTGLIVGETGEPLTYGITLSKTFY